jgi:O-antigen/teichoic acid export membrane protein
MGIIVSQSIKSSVGYYLGVILGAINTLFVATHFLSTDELAVSRILLENSLILAAFIHLGAPHMSDKFFARFKDEKKGHNGILVYLFLFPICGSLILLVMYFIFNENIQSIYLAKSPTIIPYLWLSLPMSLFWSFVMILEAYSRANNRIAVPTFLRETLFRVINILLIIAYGLDWISFEVFLFINSGVIFVIVLALLFYLKILGKLYINLRFLKLERQLFLETIKFGGLVILGGLGVNLILFLDRNIIAQKIGTEAVAIFLVASYIASTIEIPAKAIKQISGPILSEYIYNSNYPKIQELYKKSSLNLMLIGGIMLVLITVNIDALLNILPKNGIYIQGKWIVVIIASAKWIEMSLGLNKVNTLIIILMAVLVVFLNYLLIPKYGLLGSAMATGLVTLVSSVFRLFYVQYRFKLNPFSNQELRMVIFMSILATVGYFIPNLGITKLSLILSIGMKSAIILLIYILVLLKYNISEDISILYKKMKSSI